MVGMFKARTRFGASVGTAAPGLRPLTRQLRRGEGREGSFVATRAEVNVREISVNSKSKSGKEGKDDNEGDGLRPASPIGEGEDLIYVGKPKGAKEVNDKTKYIKDDERLYPGREDVGPLLGAVGGFAGGEKGLKNFASTGDIGMSDTKIKDEIKKTAGVKPKPDENFKNAAPISKGSDLIYVGKPKGAKEVNDKTKYIKDDARLYPGREDLGFFTGATGGFAGGEVGLKRFAVEGKAEDIDIRNEDDTYRKTQGESPLAFAFGLGGVVTLAATLTNPEVLVKEVGEIANGTKDLSAVTKDLSAVSGEVVDIASKYGIDQQVVLTAVGVLGALAVGSYTYTQVKKAAASAIETTKTVAITSLFGIVVGKIALEILFK